MDPLRILVIGAHPDDGDIKAGGTASQWCRLGHHVHFVSVTDGGAGHQSLRGPVLAERRRGEARAAGTVIGATYTVLEFPDAGLLPTLDARHRLIRLIRGERPDLILTHRLSDYHPDHRYTATLVQDAAYLVTVPAVCADVPHLKHDPVIACFSDDFKKPVPFSPDVVIDIGDDMERMIDMLHCHESQFYEWLPFNSGQAHQVPAADVARRRWLGERIRRRLRPLADRYRQQLLHAYGPERGRSVEYVEAFEVSEHGAPLTAAARARLFPFLPPIAEPDDRPAPEWVDLRSDD